MHGASHKTAVGRKEQLSISDGNYGSLTGAGSYGSVPFKEPFKRAFKRAVFLKGAGLLGLSAK